VPAKADPPTRDREFPNVTDSSVDKRNALSPILTTEFGITMDFNFVLPKAECPILVTEFGITRDIKLLSKKSSSSIFCHELGRATEDIVAKSKTNLSNSTGPENVIELIFAFANAKPQILVTERGIKSDSISAPKKADGPM
jgi:hypothetical protein